MLQHSTCLIILFFLKNLELSRSIIDEIDDFNFLYDTKEKLEADLLSHKIKLEELSDMYSFHINLLEKEAALNQAKSKKNLKMKDYSIRAAKKKTNKIGLLHFFQTFLIQLFFIPKSTLFCFWIKWIFVGNEE